ncbi:MAG TPA: lipopolysaccharide heptosyltransferase II [Candidatus Limnocylindrales bacterium]|nr:lipopolysaccharide heptosyltransferase II [Candidatus Limnocylindrales bacterium]
MTESRPGARLVPRQILVRGVNWLGDAAMTTPALQRLREGLPDASITLLSPQKLADLWLHCAYFDQVITFGPDETPWSIGRRLRTESFDTFLVLPNSPRSALEGWFARIPERIGFARPWRNWLLTQPVASRPGRQLMRKRSPGEIHRLTRGGQSQSNVRRYRPSATPAAHQMNEYLHLVSQLGANPAPIDPSLSVHPEETIAAITKFGLNREAAGKSVLGLNPGAEYGPAKRWPLDKFIQTASEVQKRANCVWLIFGAQSDLRLANQIEAALRSPHSAIRNLAGKTSLRELMALLKGCRALLTNDTGPMHVAAAIGTPVIVPFGSTSPELTGPGLCGVGHDYLFASDVPCAPCFRRTCPIDLRCMNAITVEIVAGAMLEALGSATKPVQRQK